MKIKIWLDIGCFLKELERLKNLKIGVAEVKTWMAMFIDRLLVMKKGVLKSQHYRQLIMEVKVVLNR